MMDLQELEGDRREPVSLAVILGVEKVKCCCVRSRLLKNVQFQQTDQLSLFIFGALGVPDCLQLFTFFFSS